MSIPKALLRPKILIIEDEPEVVQSAAQKLAELGFDVAGIVSAESVTIETPLTACACCNRAAVSHLKLLPKPNREPVPSPIERELHHTQERLQYLLAASPAVIYTATPVGALTFVSENIRSQLGHNPEELMGSSEAWLRLVHPDDVPVIFAALQRVPERDVDGVEYRIQHKQGGWRWIRSEFRVVRGLGGDPIELVGYIIDVTERKRAREESKQREMLLAEAQQVAHVGSWNWDIAANIVSWSDECYRIFGMEPQAIAASYDAFLNRVAKEDRPRVMAAIQHAINTHSLYEVEHRIVRRDGSIRHTVSMGQWAYDGSEHPARLFGTIQDVTDRRQAEEALRFQSHLLNTVEQAVIATDPDGRVTYWNRHAEMLFGWSAAEAMDRPFEETIASRRLAGEARKALEQAATGRCWTSELFLHRRDGSRFPAQITASAVRSPEGGIAGTVSVVQDMTSIRNAEEALRESEERFRAVFEQAPVGICQVAADGQFERANPRFCRMFGYSMEELLCLTFLDVTHPDDVAESQRLAGEVFRGERHVFAIDKRYLRKDGGIMWAHSTVTLLRNKEGSTCSLVATVQDITERKAAEAALRESEERFRQLAENSSEIFWMADVSRQQLIYVSPGYESIWGRAPEELYANPISLLSAVPAEFHPKIHAYMEKMAKEPCEVEYK